MKTRLLTLVAALAATASMAQTTNQVLSRNAVGYELIPVGKGNLYLARLDFNPLAAGGNNVSNLIGTQLPGGSSVFIWDNVNQQYNGSLLGRSGWSPGSNVINVGSAFFLSVPGTAASNVYNVYLMGEVPDSTTAPTTTIAQINGIAGVGYPYPVSVAWTGTTLGASAPGGSSLFIWNPSTTGYVGYIKSRSGWGSATNLVLTPGQGFFYRTTNNIVAAWTEVKPYTWP